jgi:hypothetical protein
VSGGSQKELALTQGHRQAGQFLGMLVLDDLIIRGNQPVLFA